MSDAISFRNTGGKIEIADILISPVDESGAIRARAVDEAHGWYDAFTRDIFG